MKGFMACMQRHQARKLSIVYKWGGSLAILIVVGWGQHSAQAQRVPFEVHPDYRLRHWSVTDGLPVNNVRDILQTSDGYLWVATFDGLVRFDGHRFKVFNASNTPGLATNRIVELHEGPGGELWLATENNAVVRYASEVFTSFEEVDNQTIVAQQDRTYYNDADTLWVKSRTGLFRYHAGHLVPYRPDVLATEVLGIVRDALGRLCVSATHGAVYCFLSDGSYQHYALDDDREGAIYHLFIDRQHQLWAATESGPQVLRDGRFVALWEPEGMVPDEAKAVFYLDQDEHGRLWGHNARGWWTYYEDELHYLDGGIRNEGFAIYYQRRGPDRYSWRFQGEVLYRGTERILTQARGQISAFYLDTEGRLWIGGPSGLYLLQRNVVIQTIGAAQGLPWPNVYPLVEDIDGQVWVGTWNPQQPTFARTDGTRVTAYREGPGFPTALYIDRQGTLWLGTDGLYRWNGTRFVVHLPGIENIFIRDIRAIYEDAKQRFWVAEADTLWLGRIDSSPNTWRAFSTSDHLPYGSIRSMLETRHGEMFFATNGGGVIRLVEPRLTQADSASIDYTFEAFTTAHGLASNQIRDLYEDRNRILWIATEDRGLCRLDRRGQPTLQAGVLLCLDVGNGLFDNSLHRLIEDDYGRFWFNTNQGIFWVKHAELEAFAAGEIASVTSVSYTERDGLINREGNGGVHPAGFKARNGKIWFPSQGGVVVIDPSQVVAPKAPAVVIEEIQTEEAQYGGSEALVLPPGVRDVDIQYTALAFSRPEAVQFSYRLVGYETTWHTVGDRRVATYTNLAPGAYRFEVRAGFGGTWSEKVASVPIQRLPYVWETRWFYGMGILVLVLGIGWGYRYRVHRIEAQNRALEVAVEERTAQIQEQKDRTEEQADELRRANMLKSRFLANISHEFRTPLTLTFGPIDDWLAGHLGNSEEARPHFERARRNGQRLLRMINQLLDLARFDAQVLTLNLARYDLVAFLQQRVAAFQSLALNRDIDLQFLSDTEELWYQFDAEKMEVVVLNLLSNAFKFTPAGGTIEVGVRQEAGQAVVMVRDAGVGIASTHVPHLFDRFYQADISSTRTHDGSGIGLALCKELVELHKGAIEVESTIGKGATFIVTWPFLDRAEPLGDVANDTSRDTTVSSLDVSSYFPEINPDTRDLKADPRLLQDDASVVLVVDDNADMRAYMRFHLDPHFLVQEARDGKAGLEKAIALLPDLVVSDVMMPAMDGFSLLEALRKDVRTSHIPVVLLTAKADAESKMIGLQAGADDYLAKPFNAAELITRVENLIKLRRQLRLAFRQRVLTGEAGETLLSSMDQAFWGRVQDTIQEHLADPAFGVQELAERVGMSRRQLSRKMSSVYDTKASTLIRRMRLQRAATMLAARSGSVKEVGYAVGFRSTSRFREAFREVYGVAPSAYSGDKI